MSMMDLSGKTILLYGSGTGIDQAIAERLKECQAEIVFFSQEDITLVEPEIRRVIASSGPFDGFVFSIVHSDFRPLQYVKPELVSGILKDNYGLFIESMRILRKAKGLKDGSSVVTMSSISSIRAMKAKMAFCSAKAALDAAVRCLAVELAEKRIRVNTIQKGVVDVDFEKGHIQDIATINDHSAEKSSPLGITKATEIANMVAFLLSDAVPTMTGSSIVIDGGYSL